MDYGIYVLMYNRVFSRGIKDLTQTNETAHIFDRQRLIIFSIIIIIIIIIIITLQEPNVSILIRLRPFKRFSFIKTRITFWAFSL